MLAVSRRGIVSIRTVKTARKLLWSLFRAGDVTISDRRTQSSWRVGVQPYLLGVECPRGDLNPHVPKDTGT